MNMFARRLALGLMLSCGALAANAQVSLTTLGAPVTQDFNALPASGSATWNNNSTLPGWFHARVGTGTTIVANDGSSNAGNLYSYGTGPGGDRAFGSLGSGNAAVGNLFWGVRLQNNTGATITSLTISYTGEQWRNSAAAAQTVAFSYLIGSPTVTGSLAEFQSAGTAFAALDFPSPITGGTPGALDGNAPANRIALSTTITGLSIPVGTEIMLRWADPDQTGADHGLAIDDLSVTPNGEGGGTDPVLSISDTSAAEGDSGSTPFLFTVSLTQPAGPGGVSFDYATADGSANAGSDYVAATSSATIADGATSVTVSIDVNGDTDTEANETFSVDVGNVVGAVTSDAQGLGTINNDDVAIAPIHAIQGAGAMSPLVGQAVTTEGIVTGRKSNGFFLQTADGEGDGNDATSQAVFVFTSSAPPANAAVGNRVQVSGSVVEFIPAADLGQLPLTELGGTVSVNLLTIGNALPTPVTLTATLLDPAGALDQLEPLEGMRVTADSFTVVAATGGSTSEPNATGTTNGIFNVVLTGTPRPFREPGIQRPDAPPAGGSIPPIPQWDFNPELLTVVSRGIGGAPLDVAVGQQLSNFVGPLDYGFRRYTIVPDPAVTPTITPAAMPSAARLPTADEFTVASYNVERYFDTVNDPATDDPVLTAAALTNRLNKASLAIRNFLNTPDILGVVEMENLATLQALASKINDDAVAASQPNPEYVAYLQEGNDIGGIDVGFLVKAGEVAAGIDRIDVDAVTQLGKNEMWTEPAGGSSLLNDRPPLQLDAVVNYADGRTFPITVIVVHQRSLNGAEDDTAGGVRVRAKRQRQAEYLANRIQALQTADPDRNITVLGDFNAFEFNDGYVDAMNVVAGTPTPDNQTAVAGDGVDLVDPDLMNLFVEEPAGQRYSFVFDGNAQSLDHVLINQALGSVVGDFSLDHARINSDFPEVNRNDANSPSRLSDHDPAVAYFALPTLADLAVTIFTGMPVAPPGHSRHFSVTVLNNGPDDAEAPGVGFALDDELPDLTIDAPAGWSCDAPTVANGMTIAACASSLLPPSESSTFFLSSVLSGSEAGNTTTLVASATSQTDDPIEANNSATAANYVSGLVDFTVQISGPPIVTRVTPSATYRARVTSLGPDTAAQPKVVLRANVPGANAEVATPSVGDWFCIESPTATFEVTCTGLGVGPGVTDFNLSITGFRQVNKPNIYLQAEVQYPYDPQPMDNAAQFKSRVIGVTGF